ncbi:MAG: sugar kinase [Anaerolineales bacterium]|nr:sugar kinase [Anaerolineales bacterium]
MGNKNHRIITLGETMLRLKSPGFERFLQSGIFEATFAGGEANVAVSLANFGMDVAYITALPNNPIADACITFLRGLGVDTSFIIRYGERMGIYYLEAGANQRPSRVIYDRANSSIADIGPEQFDWEKIFSGSYWFHITGITPAISEKAAETSLAAVQQAKKHGLIVSCDYNYRKNLWKYGKKPVEIMSELVKYVDIGIANEEDCQLALNIKVDEKSWEQEIETGKLNIEKYRELCETVLDKYPNLKMQAITLRHSFNANHNGWSGCLHDRKYFYNGPYFDIPYIIDRVGSGDSFAAGLIYSLIKKTDFKDALDFAVSTSCLKHSIYGDFNRVSVDEVKRLMKGDSSGRVQR